MLPCPIEHSVKIDFSYPYRWCSKWAFLIVSLVSRRERFDKTEPKLHYAIVTPLPVTFISDSLTSRLSYVPIRPTKFWRSIWSDKVILSTIVQQMGNRGSNRVLNYLPLDDVTKKLNFSKRNLDKDVKLLLKLI